MSGTEQPPYPAALDGPLVEPAYPIPAHFAPVAVMFIVFSLYY